MFFFQLGTCPRSSISKKRLISFRLLCFAHAHNVDFGFHYPKNQRKKGDVNHRTLGKPKHELQGSESHGFQHCYFVKGTFGRGLMVIDFLGGGNSNIFVPFTPIWGRLTHFDDHIFQRG